MKKETSMYAQSSSQNIVMRSLYSHESIRLRVDILRNAYDAQSHAKIEMLTQNGWKYLDSLHYTEMYSVRHKITTYDLDASKKRASLEADEKALLKRAKMLLAL